MSTPCSHNFIRNRQKKELLYGGIVWTMYELKMLMNRWILCHCIEISSYCFNVWSSIFLNCIIYKLSYSYTKISDYVFEEQYVKVLKIVLNWKRPSYSWVFPDLTAMQTVGQLKRIIQWPVNCRVLVKGPSVSIIIVITTFICEHI